MAGFKDQVVWITGAGTGIGEASALMFAREGAKLALWGRWESMLKNVAQKAQEADAKAQTVAVDVSDRSGVNSAAARMVELWGRVDILVNNAGLNLQQRRFRDMSPEGWDSVINVNLTGAYNMINAVLPTMRAQKAGLIINVSSMAGKQASGLSGGAYTASKHGMNGLSHAINAEEWIHNIRSTALCPGEVNTPILDKRPVAVEQTEREIMMQPEDLAEAVRFLALLPARATVPEMLMVPTHKRTFKPGETG